MSEIKTNKLSSLTGTDNNITIDPDGTGDTIIASGNLGVGTTSPDALLELYKAGTSELMIGSDNAGTALLSLYEGTSSTKEGFLKYDGANNNVVLGTSGAANAVVVARDTGNVLLGTASSYGVGTTFAPSGSNGTLAVFNQNYGNGFTSHQFRYNGSAVGSIIINTSSTAYNTSSDYRLKESITDITGATDRLKQLNPVRFNFIVDPDTTVDGFLAHEVQAVVPEAVTGTHNEVDDDGNAVMQGIDQSKLVPLLVATIQEQQAAIEALTARVTALEAE